MHILHVTPRYYPATGGGQTHILELSEHFVRAGHQVTVVTTDALDGATLWRPGKSRIPEKISLHNGVQILRFPVNHLLRSSLSFPAIHRLQWAASRMPAMPVGVLNAFGRLLPYSPELAHWFRTTDQSFDIVAVMGLPFDALMLAGQTFAARHGIPFVVYPLTHFGSGDAPGSDHASQFYTMPHQNRYITSANGLIAQTETEAAYYHERGMLPERIMVAGPGIHPDKIIGGDADAFRTQFGIRGPFVLSIGLLAKAKGAFDNVFAFNLLRQRGSHLQLVLIGTVTDEFAAFWAKLPSATKDGIHLLGYLSETQKRNALAAATLFSLPSQMDSFGIVYLEAWMYRMGVIAAQTWGVIDVVQDGVNGLTVPLGSAEALASAMQRLAEDPALNKRLGDAGHNRAIQQSWSHIGDNALAFYQQLVDCDPIPIKI